MIHRLMMGFFTRAFVHFAWIGVAKWVYAIGAYTLTVDVLGLAGWQASLIVTPVLVVLNWTALQVFVLPSARMV